MTKKQAGNQDSPTISSMMDAFWAISKHPDILLAWDDDDVYGSAMTLAFDAAEWIEFELGEVVPAEWQYRPSPIQKEVEPENQFAGLNLPASEVVKLGTSALFVAGWAKENGMGY